MRTVVALVGVMALALSIVLLAIVAGDARTMVPPPEAVAESFTRQLMEGRTELSVRHLSKRLHRSIGTAALQLRSSALRDALGPPNTIESILEWMQDDRASARAMVEADRGSAVLRLRMVRERGLWVVDELP